MTDGGADLLVGIDGNAMNIVSFTSKELRRRNVDKKIIDKYTSKCFDSEYNKLLNMSMMALDNTNPEEFGEAPEIKTLDALIRKPIATTV